mmetsp:Transcript_10111/g.18058  ORF Transcript_10111/g.18058 Transcript_10111/m.18058 type:complete len:280 (+) Transcript_10111:222-1061(+)|eukprot:CAMPEP_0205920628 /NCGR_PEP_ID=MMETSP1325-20131115/11496_1 /ASSEMBLY_ACC=CAM_ASM_000708 /TAXON_ID=236786 /ORGANISM="Florenciella sp., Strain RCC1007" /LENGTH=279 /DNA_ID=CAMNT_0053288331 /DNA_START=154 /DNA_END=993 /DNA_ORIENTATION=+
MPPAPGDFHEDVDSALDDIPKELVTDKYFVLSKFKSAAVAGGPIDVKTEVSEKKGGFAGKVSCKWSNKSTGFSITKAELCPKNFIGKFEVKMAKLPIAGAEVEVKTVPSKSSGSVQCTYGNDTLFAGLKVTAGDSLKYKSATAGATMAYDGIRVGAQISHPEKDLWVGLGYKAGKYDATIEADKGMKSFTVKALAKPTSELTLACMAQSDLGNSPMTGAALCGYKFNADGQFKAKYDMSKVDCAICYKALPKVTVVGGVGIPVAGGASGMTTGLAVTMG